YQPERVTVRTVGPAPSVLVLSDTWFPGWQATVDGRSAPVLRVDHALRGVAVPAGAHVVEFRYRPQSVRLGAAVTALTLVVLVGSGAWAARPRRRQRRPAAPAPPTGPPPAG
ncbi:MAG: YfhO family protein, partial [Acidimicrobiales bacterium]